MTTQPTLSRQLGTYLTSLSIDHLPDEVVRKVESVTLDSVGVSLAGSATPWAQSAIAGIRAQVGDGDTTILGTSFRAPVSLAALANGFSGHSLDFDDDNAQVHVGACVVPAALAVAEHVGANGRSLLTAVLAGYEAAVRVGWLLRPEDLLGRGFHPTGVCNTFGAAAAAAVLLGLDGEQLAMAFGLAGSMTGGLAEFYADGAMTKRLHAGQAAQAGINAALMAAAGGTGPATVFEGKWGLGQAFVGGGSPTAMVEGLGERFLILETAQKYYPMNFSIHAPIDATLQLMAENDLGVDDVERIVARIRPFVGALVGTPAAYALPTPLAAQMSLPFGLSVAMLTGTVTLDNIDTSWTTREDVRSLVHRVTVESDSELDRVEGVEEGSVLPVDLTLTTTKGQELNRRIVFQRGDPRNPLDPEDIRTKFRTCAGRVLPTEQADELLDQLSRPAEITDVRKLARLLAV